MECARFSDPKTHIKDGLEDPDTAEPAEHGDGGKGVLLHDVHLPPPRPPLRLLPLLLDLILGVVRPLEHSILGSLLESGCSYFLQNTFAYLHANTQSLAKMAPPTQKLRKKPI